MCRHELRVRYIFGASPREAILSAACAMIAGCGMVAYAETPGLSQAKEAAVLVGGMTPVELLALVCIAALALSFYCVKTMVGLQKAMARAQEKSAESLAQIAERMSHMECVREPWTGTERRKHP